MSDITINRLIICDKFQTILLGYECSFKKYFHYTYLYTYLYIIALKILLKKISNHLFISLAIYYLIRTFASCSILSFSIFKSLKLIAMKTEAINKSIYDITVKAKDGSEVSMEKYRGKVILIVNTATICGFAKQLGSLQDIHEKFGGKGFELLAFPSNQFANQEPRDGDEISDFCKMNYGVTFNFFDKIKVNGQGASPLFLYLQEVAPGLLGSKSVKWNFTKFLINKNGIPVKRYSSMTPPAKIIPDIIQLIEQNEL